METNNLLNVLINFLHYIIIITSVLVFALLLYSVFCGNGVGLMDDGRIYVPYNEGSKAELEFKNYVKIFISLITTGLFIKTIFHLRIATLKMIKNDMFNSVVAMNLRWTGISIILYKLSSILGEYYSKLSMGKSFSVEIGFEGFETFIFIIILGLFFILLSNVIKSGISLKSENDLTI